MYSVDTAVPSTFEAFLAANDLTHDHPNLEGWRRVWQNELQVEATVPAVTPPCPAWCTLPAGHPYDSYDVGSDLPMTHLRGHVGFTAEHVQVDATERSQDGAVTVDVPTAFVNVEDDLDPKAVRAFAADLLRAADELDRITR